MGFDQSYIVSWNTKYETAKRRNSTNWSGSIRDCGKKQCGEHEAASSGHETVSSDRYRIITHVCLLCLLFRLFSA